MTDQHQERADLIAGRQKVQYFESLQDLLKHVDVVSVAVPTSGHYAVVKTCLEAKKHVLVEKPITVHPKKRMNS